MRAILMLEDGKVFWGETDVPVQANLGSVCFDTRVVGYQESITDTVNIGKILVFTYPLIGNYGVAAKFNESGNTWPRAVILKEKSGIPSNWQSEEDFDSWAKRNRLSIIYGVDTRTLAVYLREKGEMLGVVSSSELTPKKLLNYIESEKKNFEKQDWFKETSTNVVNALSSKDGYRVVVIDLGVSQRLIKSLEKLGLNITIVPYNIKPEEILSLSPDALVISSGPEGNGILQPVAATVKELLGSVPILGISTGASVLALSLGAEIKKMHIGHRGLNYPVRVGDSFTGKITVQNHSYVVDTASLRKNKEVNITAYNFNDNTVEEFESKKLKVLGVFYSLLSPGFEDVNPVLVKFFAEKFGAKKEREYA